MTESTLCPYCGTGCGLKVEISAGVVASVSGDPSYPVNVGRICRKPTELGAAVHATDRAVEPLMRSDRDHGQRPVSWAAALDHSARELIRIRDRHGPEAIAFYISGQLLTEDYYVVNKLAKGFLGTNNVDSNSRLCMSSAVAGYNGAFGSDGPPPAYADLEQSDCFFVLGSNTAACHPIIFGKLRERCEQGASLIVADPRRTATAEAADLHLAVRPGTDLPLLNSMLFVLERQGLLDLDFITRHTDGFEQAIAVARGWEPKRAAEVCGLDAVRIEQAAESFGTASAAMTLWSMGANQSTVGTLKNRALINLCLATGNLGRPGCGPLSLTGQPNAMGGRETGGLAHLLPGYRELSEANDRAEIEAHWNLAAGAINPEPGLAASEIIDGLLEGGVKAVLIAATNPIVSMPDGGRVREALERAELLVVQDCHQPTETSALADVVLPAAAWPEKEGTMTNSERRVGLVKKLLDPPGQARPDWRIYAELATRLGFRDGFRWQSAAEVYDEYAACTTGRACDVSGISHQRLRDQGSLQWPEPASESVADAGAGRQPPKRLYEDLQVKTASGRSRFAPTEHQAPADPTDSEYSLTLTTGRLADHWHTLSRTGKSTWLSADSGPFVALNPGDAERAGLEAGAEARVRSRRGEALLTVELDPSLSPGVAFAPFHWGALHAAAGKGTVNALSHDSVDPTSKQPELKAIAVAVEPVAGKAVARRPRPRQRPRRLVVVGTGMAGLATVEELLGRDPDGWRVTMLGEEPGPVYNRIKLSRLLAGECGPEDLDVRPLDWYAANGIDLRGGCAAAALDLEGHAVIDATGSRHSYDALVLATGSRAATPPIPGCDLPRVGVFRTWSDVSALTSASAVAGQRAVVLGGGLLGLEAAAGLRRRGAEVTVVEPAPRLMSRQLDATAARMLRLALRDRGVEVRLGTSVEEIRLRSVWLSDGARLPSDLVVIAAGIRPEVSLARAAGLDVDRGIVVDDTLRTDEASVWAVGECAQHRESVYGLWAPLAEQARVAGAVIAGDPACFRPQVNATVLKIADIDLYAGGISEPDPTHDEIEHRDTRRGTYRRLVLAGERLVGATLVGEIGDAARCTAALRSGAAVDPDLLEPGVTIVSEDPERIVCSCNGVSLAEIDAAIDAHGLTSVAEIAAVTKASTGCGGCGHDLRRILAKSRSSDRNSVETEATPLPARITA